VYHDVSSTPCQFSCSYDLNVTPEIFDYQLNFIKNNFNIISPDDLLEKKIPKKAALITFDDGFKSYFKNAIPILEKNKVPSIIFLNMEPVKGGLFWSGLITYLCTKREDFKDYLKKKLPEESKRKTLFLNCSTELVENYLEETGKSFEKEVRDFVGEFADESDLEKASGNPLVFYGNHLFNHHVPLLLSNEELIDSVLKNENELRNYSCYRNMFSFPFGQPDTCYSEKQIDLLFANGISKIFSSNGRINYNCASDYLYRIPLSSFNNSSAKIWFQIFQKEIRKYLRVLN
jgi:hypothetical protein